MKKNNSIEYKNNRNKNNRNKNDICKKHILLKK